MKIKKHEKDSIIDDLLSWSDGFEESQCFFGVRTWNLSDSVKEKVAAIVESQNSVCLIWNTRPEKIDVDCFSKRVFDNRKEFEQLVFIDGELMPFGGKDSFDYEVLLSEVYELLGVVCESHGDIEPF